MPVHWSRLRHPLQLDSIQDIRVLALLFRRAFALNMLRNGADVFAFQKLLGHSDLQIMRRYLAQHNTGTQAAHMTGSPVDNGL